MSADVVFQPAGTLPSVRLDVTTATANVALPNPNGSDEYRFYYNGTSACWINFGGQNVTAAIPASGVASNGMALAPGGPECLRIPAGVTHVAAILPAGSTAGVLNITAGNGA